MTVWLPNASARIWSPAHAVRSGKCYHSTIVAAQRDRCLHGCVTADHSTGRTGSARILFKIDDEIVQKSAENDRFRHRFFQRWQLGCQMRPPGFDPWHDFWSCNHANTRQLPGRVLSWFWPGLVSAGFLDWVFISVGRCFYFCRQGFLFLSVSVGVSVGVGRVFISVGRGFYFNFIIRDFYFCRQGFLFLSAGFLFFVGRFFIFVGRGFYFCRQVFYFCRRGFLFKLYQLNYHNWFQLW